MRTRRARERALIIAVFVTLPLAALPGVLPEPFPSTYPALTLPSFAATPRDGGFLDITRPRVTVEHAEGPDLSLPYSALLPAGSPNPIQLFRSALGSADAAADPSVRPWLQDRLAVALPDIDPTAVTVTWIRSCYRTDASVCDREVVESFRIEWDDS
jgi:hypothetical protein